MAKSPNFVFQRGIKMPDWCGRRWIVLCQVLLRLPVAVTSMFEVWLVCDHGSGVSLMRIPSTGRPISSTSRIQPSHSEPSFTTLNTSASVPSLSLTGPTVSRILSAGPRGTGKPLCR